MPPRHATELLRIVSGPSRSTHGPGAGLRPRRARYRSDRDDPGRPARVYASGSVYTSPKGPSSVASRDATGHPLGLFNSRSVPPLAAWPGRRPDTPINLLHGGQRMTPGPRSLASHGQFRSSGPARPDPRTKRSAAQFSAPGPLGKFNT